MEKQSNARLKFWGGVVCSLAILFYFLDYFIQISPSVMIRPLMQHFEMNARDLGIMAACFYYAYLCMQIPAGILLDKFGARLTIGLAMLTCAFGVLLVADSNSFILACLGRLFTGMCAGHGVILGGESPL